MDLATLLGLIGAIGIVLTAIVTGGEIGLFINFPSIMIVGGGFAIAIEFEEIREEDRDMLIQHIVRKQSQILREERLEGVEDAA